MMYVRCLISENKCDFDQVAMYSVALMLTLKWNNEGFKQKRFSVCSAGCINRSSEIHCGFRFHPTHENVNAHITHED
jgi:hypothetical protein